jgi:hypothetical protein
VTNLDRTARNTNMLMWHRRLHLIDHGAALYFHHGGGDYLARSEDPFPMIKDHVLLPFASGLREADARMTTRLAANRIERIVGLVPDAWLAEDGGGSQRRAAYTGYLRRRLETPHAFLEEAIRARAL